MALWTLAKRASTLSSVTDITHTGHENDLRPVSAARRLHLTVLFFDIVASTRLAEQVDPEVVAAVLHSVRAVCRSSIQRHGGFVVRLQGDGGLAVFGYPEPSEYDGRRASEAALDLVDAIAQLPFEDLPAALRPVRMHCGIHAGLVLVLQGDIERGWIDLVGDPPNSAARLASLAEPGCILAGLDALGAHAHLFSLGVDSYLQLLGRQQPLRVAQVQGRSQMSRPQNDLARLGTTTLVGRNGVLQDILELVETGLGKGCPQAVVVLGEAGIGKSRLLEETRRRLEGIGVVVLRGTCANYQGSSPLQPFLQVCECLPGLGVAGSDFADDTARLAAGEEVVARLHASAATARIALLLDDWQWADDASRQVLERLFHLPCALTIVLATRPASDNPDRWLGTTVIELHPFSEDQTKQAIAQWVPHLDPLTAREVHRRAGGVPLLVEELCHSLRAGARIEREVFNYTHLEPDPGPGGGVAPAWLFAAIAARVSRLPERWREVLDVASVLGATFPLRLLMDTMSASSLDAELVRLAEQHLVFLDGDQVHFSHGLTREAVLDTVRLQVRADIHRRALAALNKQADAVQAETTEAMAYHSFGAGDWLSAAAYGEKAGDKAVAALAFDRGRAHYLQTLEALDRMGLTQAAEQARWCALVHKLGLTCIFDPLALPRALPLFERGFALAQTLERTDLRARSAYWLGYMAYGFGRPRHAVAHLRAALADARTAEDNRLAAQIEAALGQSLAAACSYDEALSVMNRALAAKRGTARVGSSVAVGSAFTLACKASVLADRGEFEAALAAIREARALVSESLHPVANSLRNWSMVVLAWAGRWNDVLSVVAEAETAAERARALLPLAISRAVGGHARWMRDRDVTGYDQMAAAVRWMEDRDCGFFTAIYYGWLAEAAAALTRGEEARRFAAAALRRARVGERLGEAAACRTLAQLAATQGHFRRAERWLLHADVAARRRVSAREQALNAACRAQVLQTLGNEDAARAARREAVELLERLGLNWFAQRALTEGR
jgi:class 3 adenylate cyclase/tetratricopeptide (TPR) repeat protein